MTKYQSDVTKRTAGLHKELRCKCSAQVISFSHKVNHLYVRTLKYKAN